MRAGPLDQRVALQRKVTVLSPSGQPTDSWVILAQRWAAITPVTGDERNAAQQWIAREQSKFTMRWSQETADLSPLDQVVFPAADAANSPAPSRSVYDIISVHEEGRNEKLIAIAARRVG